ncbi:hypothetical protein OKW37_000196 [Paraburkholderia sp. MM5482-R2]
MVYAAHMQSLALLEMLVRDSPLRAHYLLAAGFDVIGHNGFSPYGQDCNRLRQD